MTNTITPENWAPRLADGIRLQYEAAQSGWVLLYPEGMVQLNQSATEILKLCDGTRQIDTIVKELETLFNATGIESEIRQLISEGQRRGWVT